jgi:hypothetical protein
MAATTKYFEDFQVGDKFSIPAKTLTDAHLGFVRDTCNGVSQQESSRKVHLLGQCIGTVLGL